MTYDYLSLLIGLVISLILAIVIFFASYILSYYNPDIEKESAYECGFDPFDDARMKFDIRFYLVAILFIIFDLEVTFLFPWTLCLNQVGFYGYWIMILFLFILTIGFIFEWKKGALEWE